VPLRRGDLAEALGPARTRKVTAREPKNHFFANYSEKQFAQSRRRVGPRLLLPDPFGLGHCVPVDRAGRVGAEQHEAAGPV